MQQDARQAVLVSLYVVAAVWLANGMYLAPLSKGNAVAFWAVDLVQWVVLPVLVLGYLSRRHAIGPGQYGFAFSDLRKGATYAWSVPATLTFYLAYAGTSHYAAVLLGFPGADFSYDGLFPDSAPGALIRLYSGLTAGLVESIFFIGLPWLLWTASGRRSPILFTALVSVIFAWAHWEQGLPTVAGALAFNLVACAWYFRLHTLWPIAIGHAITDLIEFY